MMESYSPRTDASSTLPLGALSSYAAFRTPLVKTVAGNSLLPQFALRQWAARKQLSNQFQYQQAEPRLLPDPFMREHLVEFTLDRENQYDFVLLPGTVNARPGMKILSREDVDIAGQDGVMTSPKDQHGAPVPSSSSTDAFNVNFTNFCRYGASCFRKNCRFRHDGGSFGSPNKSLSPNAAPADGDARAKTPPADALSLASSELSGSSTPSSMSPREEH